MTTLIPTPKDENLIFDVGMHRGEDTEFYLKKGFRVVAFEANPDLVRLCSKRFHRFIDEGKLNIIEGAIVDSDVLRSGKKTIDFYRNEEGSGWGTICPAWADRNERSGNSSTKIEVTLLDFTAAIQEHGIPHYMKIDIEGCDTICLKVLAQFRERPNYLSIESDKTSLKNIRAEIDLFDSLGYRDYKAVEQSSVVSLSPPSPALEGVYTSHVFDCAASGLFGAELPGKWLSRREILRLYRMIRIGYYLLGDNGILNRQFRGAGRLRKLVRRALTPFVGAAVPGWYDTHARLPSMGL